MVHPTEHGRAIRAFRRAHGLTQKAFGERVGVVGATVRRYELEGMMPSAAVFAAMARLGPATVPVPIPPDGVALKPVPVSPDPSRWPPGSFGEYAEQFLVTHLPRLRPTSRSTYACQLRRHVLPVLGAKPLDEVTRRDVRDMLRGVLQKGLSHGSVRFVGVVTTAVLSLAFDDELIASDPSHRAMRRLVFRIPRYPRRPLTSQEAARFLAAVQREEPRPLLHLAFRLLARTGMRVGELVAVRLGNVDLPARRLHVVNTYHGAGRFGPTKSGKPRIIPVTPDAEAAIRDLLRGRESAPPDAFLVPSPTLTGRPVSTDWMQRVFRRVANELGWDRSLSPHSFRHAVATHLCEAGVNVLVVRDLLGHIDLATTMAYAKRATVQDAAAVARLDGFGT